MEKFLKESELVDYSHISIQSLASKLANGLSLDEDIAKACFLYVRDEINHSGDNKDNITTYKASDVLKYKTGWCYSKSILLAALLRANNIPTGFCYQRLSCSEYAKDVYCLHGLNTIYLKKYGWYRVDARGNKAGVEAQFIPPQEKLAFELQENEIDLPEIYDEPLDVIVDALKNNKSYDAMVANFPDMIVEENQAQKKYKTIEEASRLLKSMDTSYIPVHVKYMIENSSYFFLATSSKDGTPNINYKGGEKGFVHVLDENTIIFPDIVGNGIFHGMNDIIQNPNIAMLFIDFVTSQRFKVNGTATIIDEVKDISKYLDYTGFDYPPRVIKVDVTYVIGNCSKNIDNVRKEIVEGKF